MKEFFLGRSKEEVLRLLPEREIILLDIAHEQICVGRLGEKVFAFESLCPHRRVSLSHGMLTDSREIICHLHGYRFSLETGKVILGSCAALKIFSATLDEEGLKINFDPSM